MAIKTIHVIVDDYDGKELAEETKPIHVQVGRLAWDLYLSDANERKLQDALAPFVNGAVEATGRQTRGTRRTTVRKASTAEARRAQRAALQKWAKSKRLKVPGDRGRVDSNVAEAFYAAHPEETRHFS
jgi:Lsr2